MRFIFRVIFSFLISVQMTACSAVVHEQQSKIQWQTFDEDLFEQAQRHNKFVLLDLEAIWCHWCHVMDERTYQDDRVVKLLQASYISVKVDQDSRPDLANRYREFGWPATIIFAPDGTEIVKRAGYIAPDNMLKLLQVVIDDPSPEVVESLTQLDKFSNESSLSKKLKHSLKSAHLKTQDKVLGGLTTFQKYIDRDSVEYALLMASQGNKDELAWAELTLDNARALIDPVWGGVYQYSTHRDWKHAHYEKIMSSQASYMRIYALAYGQLNNAEYLQNAKFISQYVDTFLTSPQGAFYTSQDADVIQGQHSDEYFQLNDEQRRAQGIPRIDKHIYSRENGWMIESLATLYEVSGDISYLTKAIRAANWINENRKLPNGGYLHGDNDKGGPYLGDSLAMARASLHLYRVTAERKWLSASLQTALYIQTQFKSPLAGYASAKVHYKKGGNPIRAVPQIDENISLARFTNLLFHYTGNQQVMQITKHSMRYLATERIALERITEAGILLADFEVNNDPVHITILANKKIAGKNNRAVNLNDIDNGTAIKLFNAGLRHTRWYKRIEWWDEREGELMNNNISYPVLTQSSAFVCNNGRCSLPLLSAESIMQMLDER